MRTMKMTIMICLLTSNSSVALAQYQVPQSPPPGIVMDNNGYYGNGSTWGSQVEVTRQRIDSANRAMGYGEYRQPAETQRQYQLQAESNRITNRAMVDGLSYDRAAVIERLHEALRGR